MSLDGYLGRDAIESVLDVQNAITAGGSITTNIVTASTLNTNLMTVANDQINAIGSSTDIIVNTSTSGSFKVDNLKVKSNTLSSSNTNGDINVVPNGSGKILLGTLPIKADQTVSVSEDNYVLTYDNASNVISLQPSAGGGVPSQLSNSDMNIINSAITVSNSFANLTITNGTTGSTIIDGTLTFKGNEISTQQTNGFINIKPDGTGKIILDEQLYVDRDGITQQSNSDIYLTTTGKVRVTNMSLQDKTLKAEVGDLTLTTDDTTNKVLIGSLPFKLDQTVGAGQDNHVLTYDHSTGKIQLEALSSTSNWTTTGSDVYRLSNVGVGANSSTINSQLMVKDTGASHTAVQITSGASQDCSLKLSRGSANWFNSGSGGGNETIGLHLAENSLLFSYLTSEGSNLDGFSGDAMRIDVLNHRVGIASYPSAPGTTLQLGNVASGRAETLRIQTAVTGVEQYIQMGTDASGNFIENSTIGTNTGKALTIRQGSNGNRIALASNGKVGINTTSPESLLTVEDDVSNYTFLQINGKSGYYTGIKMSRGVGAGSATDNTFGLVVVDNGLSFDSYIAKGDNVSGRQTFFFINDVGYTGFGTSTPYTPIHVNGGSSTTQTLASAPNKYISATNNTSGTWGYTASTTQGLASCSIYATHNIITSAYFACHGTTSFSDRRIKQNFEELNDGECLEKLRQLKPTKYQYKDIIEKGNEVVYGFIAQEVKEVLSYAVETMRKAIPNIYDFCIIQQDRKTLLFKNKTIDLLSLTDGKKVQFKTFQHKEKEYELECDIINQNSIVLKQRLSDEFEKDTELFIYGQYVDDFHTIKKDHLYTLTISAIQEIDRVQASYKARLSTLEGRMGLLEQRLLNAGL